MFNLSGSEIVIILLLALVVLGPDKLPEAMRRAGRMWGELRKLSSSFQDEVRKGFEEPTQELRQTASTVKKAASFDLSPTKGAVKKLLEPSKPGVVRPKAADDGGAAAVEPASAAEAAATAVESEVQPEADATP